jgi:3-methyladenine DNA glycosylase AlkC
MKRKNKSINGMSEKELQSLENYYIKISQSNKLNQVKKTKRLSTLL